MSTPQDQNRMAAEKVDQPETGAPVSPQSSRSDGVAVPADETERPKETFGQRLWRNLKTPGSALQIVLAALLAVAIGLAVTFSVDVPDIPTAAPVILSIPGNLWLRALRATVLPLIATAIILAVQNLKNMAEGGEKLAKWTISYYVLTTILAVVHSQILVARVWAPMMTVMDLSTISGSSRADSLVSENKSSEPHDIVVDVFNSFIPNNVIGAFAQDQLLAVLITSVVIGCLIKGPDSSLLRAIKEVDRMVFIVIEFLIKLAPIGVFFLILGNLMTLDIAQVGKNLGLLIASSLVSMAIHLWIVFPIIFFAFTRRDPYGFWLKCSPAWITAWGSASSAATLPVTLRVLEARGVAKNVFKFTAPLGCLINMDGTAIYFPAVVVFLAASQGIPLNAGDYTIIVLLSTLSSIATTPIPSSSLVLTIIIANSVEIPVEKIFAVVVAIDWLIDRFRTALNVSSDCFAAVIMEKVTGITDDDDTSAAQAALDNVRGNQAV